jgi:hypothetical protein
MRDLCEGNLHPLREAVRLGQIKVNTPLHDDSGMYVCVYKSGMYVSMYLYIICVCVKFASSLREAVRLGQIKVNTPLHDDSGMYVYVHVNKHVCVRVVALYIWVR